MTIRILSELILLVIREEPNNFSVNWPIGNKRENNT